MVGLVVHKVGNLVQKLADDVDILNLDEGALLRLLWDLSLEPILVLH